MPLRIIRNDITKMDTEAIVNTANRKARVGSGCDYAIYTAAGYDELLKYREEKIGLKEEGEAFVTPGFNLKCRIIIHTVSPLFIDGEHDEEKKLRMCYKNSLKLALEEEVESIAFPLISTGGFGYPSEEGMRIAVDEINAFLMKHDMLIYLVVFGSNETKLGSNIYPGLESYIDANYVKEKINEEYYRSRLTGTAKILDDVAIDAAVCEQVDTTKKTFSEYLLYLIDKKGMTNAEVYKRAIVDKKVFSKMKNNPEYHPQKLTALCLCIGAKLGINEANELLLRAGYALSPCDKTDIIFSYFIKNEIYDMIELDIQLEQHGLPCIIE